MRFSPTPYVTVKPQGKKFVGNREHLKLFRALLKTQGVAGWNDWYGTLLESKFDLRGINLSQLQLNGIDLSHVNLSNANLSHTDLGSGDMWGVNFANANLSSANLDMAKLKYAQLEGADLSNARLIWADLAMVNAKRATLTGADLSHADISGGLLRGADLSGAVVTGVNTWGIETDEFTIQKKLIIRNWFDPLERVVDSDNEGTDPIVIYSNNIETAHLLYMFTRRNKKDKSEKIKTVIDAMTQNVVLILGNFGLRRKAILKTIRKVLALKEYAPIIFDFDCPEDRDLIESVAILAGLSKFIIADFTDPHSTPLEAMLIISGFKVPFAPIIAEDKNMFGMFEALRAKYDWVLKPWKYKSKKHLERNLSKNVIDNCETMRSEIQRRRLEVVG